MSVQAISWVLSLNHSVNTAQKMVLVALANYADTEGVCWPGQETIAQHASMSRRSVQRHIKTLEAEGWLVRERRESDDGRGRKTDCYTLNLDQGDNLSCDNGGRTNVTTVSPSIEPSENRQNKLSNTRGSRIPFDWGLDLSDQEFALDRGLSMEMILEEADKFRDYWESTPGAKGRKVDWPATWRNWIRRKVENEQNRTVGTIGHASNSPVDKRMRAFLSVAAGSED